MAKGLNQVQIGLTFTADTGQAKAQLQDLKNTINGLYSSTAQKSPVEGLTPKVNDALNAVGKLKTALEQATNVDTGRLDLSKFSQQLQKGGITLKQYANHLTQLGPTGERAFLQLAQSIVTAEVPMRRANAALTEMWTTLKNTARWQLSSSILHGFMGSVQQAYGYAQDLNESLNNIRIVTGQNIDQMARFADQANKAAKALSATTTDYTNASLIYYQQGLSDSEVKERTDVTIKMANVARQSAEIVSDQMTAVWNNFDDGTKSLEYYADVMTALGAATASSTDEIAQGLEKFSAIAGTVGLSYEYATAALATVTAETRQSADVVGTAFKTLFARIEGLSLGETLEDGTDLNKYSEALDKVGVKIKDASGEMRSMDDILNDLGARWQTLAKDEQIALAQTVAGVRQYNQLISLMDNWDVMQENLGTAYGSTGALQEQADIYGESWEAASKRAQAAAESIYTSLLDDEFFIKLTDTFGNLLEDIGKFTDAIGGMPGTLSLVAAVMTRAFGPQIAANITQFVENFKIMTGQAEQTAAVMRDKTIIALQAFTKDLEMTSASGIETQVMIDQVQHAYDLQEISERINEEHVQEIKELMQIEQQYGNIASTAAHSAEEASSAQTKRLQSMRAELVDDAIERGETAEQGRNLAQGVENNFKQFGTVQEMSMRLQDKPKTKTSTLVSELEESKVELYGPLGDAVNKYIEIRDRATSSEEEAVQKQKELQEASKAVREEIKHFGSDTEYADEVIQTYAENFKGAHTNIKSSSKTLKEVGKGFVDQSKKVKEGEKALNNYQKRVKITENTIKKAGNKIVSFGQKFTQGLQGVSSFAIGLTSLSAAIDTLNNPDLSTWEKFSSVLMSMSMGIGSLISGISSFTKTTGLATAAKTLFAAAVENANDKIYEELAAQTAEQIVESQGVTLATATIMSQRAKAMAWLASKESLEELSEEEIKEQLIAKAGIAADTAEIIAKNLKSGATLKEAMAEAGLTTAKSTGIVARISATGATIAETLAQWGLNAAMAPFVGIMLAAVAAMLPYIAAAGAVALVIYGLVKVINAKNEALKEAQEREKRTAENLQEIKSRLEEVTASMEKLDQLSTTFENLTKGSLEWTKALIENATEIQKIRDEFSEIDSIGGISVGENGESYVNEVGEEYINQEINKRLTTAANVNYLARANAKQAEIDNLGNIPVMQSMDFSSLQTKTTWEDGAENTTTQTEASAFAALTDKQIKQYLQVYEEGMLDTEETQRAILGTMKKNAIEEINSTWNVQSDEIQREALNTEAVADQAFANFEKMWDDKNSAEWEVFEEYINELEVYFQKRIGLEKELQGIAEEYFASKIKQIGSNRTVDQSSNFITKENITGYEIDGDWLTYQKASVNETTGETEFTPTKFKMNKHTNYTDKTMPEEIKKFLEIQGYSTDDYVAQRSGELYVKGENDSEEKSFTQDEVLQVIGEYYGQEAFKANFADNLRTELAADTETVDYTVRRTGKKSQKTKVDYDTLTDEQVINLDNFKLGLDEAFEGVEEKSNKTYNALLDLYGTSNGKLQEFANDTEYIDTSSRAFELWSEKITKTDADLEEAKQELKEINALGELEAKSGEFTQEMQSEGFSEEAAADAQEYAKHLMEIADESENLSDELDTNAKAAQMLSKQVLKMNRGVETLADNYDDWGSVLKKSSKESAEYFKAMSGMQKALSDVLDVQEDFISDDFVTEHLEDIEKAATGNADAIDRLKSALSEQIILDIAGVDKFEDLAPNLQEAITKMQGIIDSNKLDIGDSIELNANGIDTSGFIAACQGVANAAGMTVDEANAYFDSLGYDVEFETEEKTIQSQKPVTKTVTEDSTEVVTYEDGTKVTLPATRTWSYNDGFVPVTETIQVPAMATNGKTPKIKSITKKATGAMNNFSGSNTGGKSPGKSGGGGSKPQKAEKVKKTKKSDVVERYKEINDALDDMADALDKASGKADRLYGAARVKAMRDQAKLMRDEIDLLKKKRTEAEKYKDQDKAALEAAAKAAGFKYNSKTKTYLNYDEKGNITDYTVEMEKLYKQLNDAETKMDKMSTKEAQDEYKESTVQPIQDKIDELTELISAYEESRELIEDLDKDIREKEWAEEDLNFEAFQYEIELKLEIDDRDLQYLEYLLGEIEDKAFAAAERIGNLTEQADLLMSKAETSQGAIDEILGDNLSKADKKLFDQGKLDQIDWQSYIDNETFTEAEVEELLKQADELLAYNEELFELSDQVHEELRNSFAEWNEEVEKGIALFDHYDSVVDHLQNITDLTQGLTGYNAELNRNLAETKTQLASDRAASYAQVYSDQKDVADTMRNKMYNEDGTETEWFSSLSENEQEQWIKDLEVAEESVREAEENLFASTSDAIQAAIDEFETAFTSSLKEMELALAGEGGFAAWNTELERQQDISERTLKTYQETYELSKLNRQVINSINDTDNVKAKQALLEIQEEIYQYQKDGKEMSQYELDYLQKKYELRLAEIALEEAQNAKSQVRMSRDSEGNWGYVYTADEDKVAEAEQNYEDKLYEITNLTQEYQDQVSASIIQTYQEFNDAMQEIYDRNAEGLYSSEEEFLNAIAETQAFYQGKLDFQYEQLDIATANSKALYEDDWTSYQFSTNAKIDSNKGFQNSFNDTMAGVTTGYKDSEKALSEFSGKVGTVNPETGKGTGLLGDIAKAYNNMETQVNKNLGNISKALGLKEGASLDLKNFAANAKKYLVGEEGDKSTSVKESSKKAYDQIKLDSENIKKILIGKDGKSGLLKSVEQFSTKWTKHIQDIIDKNEALVTSINALNKALSQEDDKKKKPKDTPKDTPKNNNDDKKKQDEKLASRAASIVTGVHNGTIKNTGSGWRPNAKKAGYTDEEIALALKVINDSKAGSGYSYNYKKALELLGYDTGGYTGEWGKEGKLALLHQKELVLNAGETENFLLAMDVLREITKAITLQSIIPDASKFNFGGKNIIEQDVTIHAEFPNVTDHNEIEMALSNLVNTASQYANRK